MVAPQLKQFLDTPIFRWRPHRFARHTTDGGKDACRSVILLSSILIAVPKVRAPFPNGL